MVNAVLSQIFAKLDQGSAFIGQLWDHAIRVNYALPSETVLSKEIAPPGEPTITSTPVSSSPLPSLDLVQNSKKKRLPPPRTHPSLYLSIEEDLPKLPQNPEITAVFGELERKVDEFKSGNECADFIIQMRDRFQKEYGFYSIYNDMTNWINQLRHGFSWDAQEKERFRKRLTVWREKLLKQVSRAI